MRIAQLLVVIRRRLSGADVWRVFVYAGHPRLHLEGGAGPIEIV